MTVERFRWWHIAQVMPLEADLFGAEQWSAAMFWNELANGHYYLVAIGTVADRSAGSRADRGRTTRAHAGCGHADFGHADCGHADRGHGGAGPAGEAGDGPGAGPAGEDLIIGYAGLAVSPPYEAWVQNIAVRREAQRRGVGRTLLEALLAEARRRDIHKVLLEVAVDNAPAQKLYAGYGFEAVGVRRGYYQPSNTDALVMLRERAD